MTIYSTQTNSTPQLRYGAYGRTEYVESYYSEESRTVGITMNYGDSGQIVGLVPVFPCCNKESFGQLSWSMPDSGAASVFTITLPTGTTAQFSVDSTMSEDDIEAAIQAVLPSGFVAVVVSLSTPQPDIAVVVYIYAPAGSGDTYNGGDCILNRISGTDTYASENFSGGYDDSLCDCREGEYGADALPDTTLFPLPVFGEMTGTGTDLYKNDYNSFLFETPAISSGNTYRFFLDQKQGDTYVQVTALNNNTYGTFYNVGSLCANLLWKGFEINWAKVLQAFGAGSYRFRLQRQLFSRTAQCFQSPPFCLEEWDCQKAYRTTKFTTYYNGGIIGNISKTNCGGKSWSFCCKIQVDGIPKSSTPINWNDSIRIEGMLDHEEKQYERKTIKYTTGVVNRIRDEAVRKFRWRSGNLPFWFHDRFSVYGLMADRLTGSDYNLNNPDLTLKNFCIRPDSEYAPKYKGSSRYSKVDLVFKAEVEYLIRNRCC